MESGRERERGAALVDHLLALLNAANIPQRCQEDDVFTVVPYPIGDGWTAHVFYDGPGLDYVDEFTSPSGETVDAWDWPESEHRDRLIYWRG